MMKLIIATAIAAAITVGYCDTNDTVDVSALLRAKYDRDVKSESGRVWWHGKRVSSVADPSNSVQIVTYADGKRFRDAAKVTRSIDSVTAANGKLKRTVDTKGVPKKLAEARKRREAERAAVSNVVVTTTAGGLK